MTLEQINKIVEDYESLLQLIRVKAKILLEYDPQKYSNIDYAENISIKDNEVWLEIVYGVSVDFPLEWLALDDESLKETLLLAKEEDLRQKELFNLKRLLNEQEAKDLKELQEFERLKKKFNT